MLQRDRHPRRGTAVMRNHDIGQGFFMRCARPLIIGLVASQAIAAAGIADGRTKHPPNLSCCLWTAAEDPSGAQGPMQITQAAAANVGGGDRFDLAQNRAIGRAYLAQLYGRYLNWSDAIAAFNWGRGDMDAWVRAGRPPEGLLAAVAVYLSSTHYGYLERVKVKMGRSLCGSMWIHHHELKSIR
jgi:Transglycosylase SLT domain